MKESQIVKYISEVFPDAFEFSTFDLGVTCKIGNKNIGWDYLAVVFTKQSMWEVGTRMKTIAHSDLDFALGEVKKAYQS